LSIAGGVIILLLWKVVPIFATLFAGLGAELPLPTKIVINLSNFVAAFSDCLSLWEARHHLWFENVVRNCARALCD